MRVIDTVTEMKKLISQRVMAGLAAGLLAGSCLAVGTICNSMAIPDTLMRGKAPIFDAADFGAKPDGVTDASAALQAAVDAAAAAGGGTVRVSAKGTYLMYTVFLKSDIRFEIGEGVVLKGGPDGKRYPEFGPSDLWNWNRTSRLNRRQMFYACGVTNVTLAGKGTIDGSGSAFHEFVNGGWRRKSDTEVTGRTVFFVCCRDVRVEDITISSPAGWSTWFLDCDRVTCERVKVRANPDFPNGDGLHFGGCRDTLVKDCDVDAMDDALILRSHQEAMKVPHAMERFLVTNCVLRSRHHSAIRFGWSHDYAVRNGTIVDCRFPESGLGFEFRLPEISLANGFWRDPPRYPGALPPLEREDLPFEISTVTFRNLEVHSHRWPFSVFVGKGERTSGMHDLDFENCRFFAKEPPLVKATREDHIENWRFVGCTLNGAPFEWEGLK